MKKILIIINRYNGDVFLSKPIIDSLVEFYKNPKIDLLIEKSTFACGSLLDNVNKIITFDYARKHSEQFKQEKEIFSRIYKKYDIAISLTSSDRSVIYAYLAAKISVSAVQKNKYLSWWKRLLMTHAFEWDRDKHIIENNYKALDCLGITIKKNLIAPKPKIEPLKKIQNLLQEMDISNFIVCHFSSMYEYKTYPKENRNDLLYLLNKLDIPIIATGGDSLIDKSIKESLPCLENLYDVIGELDLSEYLSLSSLSIAYIGVDTLNVHIASSQEKKIFSIYGPTNINLWRPWSRHSFKKNIHNSSLISYGNVDIFRADLLCAGCNRAGCDDMGGESYCMEIIEPNLIYLKVKEWLASK